MRLHYHDEQNVGDQLNTWLWEALLGRSVASIEPSDALFIGIGTSLRNTIPSEPERKYVFGAGCGYAPPPKIDDYWKIEFLRGPKTAGLLGVSERLAITDPGCMVRNFYSKQDDGLVVGLMPHYSSSILGPWESIASKCGLQHIDAGLDYEDFFRALSRCRLLITEAMHGAIMSDALGIPWIPFKTRASILSFKWQDWMDSLKLAVPFVLLPPSYHSGWKSLASKCFYPLTKIKLERLKKLRGFLSDRNVLDAKCREIDSVLARYR